RGYFGWAHHRVVHAGVERNEPRPLGRADVAACSEHLGDERRRAYASRVDGVLWRLWGCPAFGEVVLAHRVAVQALLSHRIAESPVQDAAAAGEVLRRRARPVKVECQSIEDIADNRFVLQRAYGP